MPGNRAGCHVFRLVPYFFKLINRINKTTFHPACGRGPAQEQFVLVCQVSGGGAVQFTQKELTGEQLGETILGLISNEDTLDKMAEAMKQLAFPDAAERIMACCLEEIEKRISSKTKMVFICNPNNPTSTLLPKNVLLVR